MVTTIEKVVSSLFAEAKDLVGQQPDAFQNWSWPNSSSSNAWSTGPTERTRMGYSACVIMETTFSREEAQTYQPTYRCGRVCSSEQSCSRPGVEDFCSGDHAK